MSDQAIGVLGRGALLKRIMSERPLLTGWIDLDQQLQPNGFDLTLREIGRFSGVGTIAVDNARRHLPEIDSLPFGDDGGIDLSPGPYHVIFNEIVDLPHDLMALGRPRSSLCRCGVAIHSAVWDAGYRGRSTSLLVVSNPAGFRVTRNARLMQLVFLGLAETVSVGYAGVYQGENLDRGA